MLRQAQHERRLIKKSVGTTVRGERVEPRLNMRETLHASWGRC
jgi:hypothetical protein